MDTQAQSTECSSGTPAAQVLIVGPDAGPCCEASRVLMKNGYSVTLATSGAAAIAHLRRPELPGGIVAMGNLSGPSWAEFMDSVLWDPQLSRVPFLMTGGLGVAGRLACSVAGAEPSGLLGALRLALGRAVPRSRSDRTPSS